MRLRADAPARSSNRGQRISQNHTCRYYSAYAWLSYRLPEFFPDIAVAQNLSRDASERVDSILRAHNAASRGRSKKFK